MTNTKKHWLVRDYTRGNGRNGFTSYFGGVGAKASHEPLRLRVMESAVRAGIAKSAAAAGVVIERCACKGTRMDRACLMGKLPAEG